MSEEADRIKSLEHLLAEARAERDEIQQKFDDYTKRHAEEHSGMERERVAAVAAAEEAHHFRSQAAADAHQARLANRQHSAVRKWLREYAVDGMSEEQVKEFDIRINAIAVEASHINEKGAEE